MKFNKIITLVVILMASVSGVLFAQTDEGGQAPIDTLADNQVLGIESGVVFAYNLSSTVSPNIGAGQEFGLYLSMAKQLQAGFMVIKGDTTAGKPLPDFNLFKLSYFVLDQVGADLYAGSVTTGGTTNMAAGLGAFYNVFQSGGERTLKSLLKLKINYLYDSTLAISEGIITAGLSVKIGL